MSHLNPIPIRDAAATVRKSREYVRKLIDAGEVIAYQNGGSKNAPRLVVDVEELKAAIRRTSVYTPKAAHATTRRPRSFRTKSQMNPAAAAM